MIVSQTQTYPPLEKIFLVHLGKALSRDFKRIYSKEIEDDKKIFRMSWDLV